ncbi:MAG: glycosyltransferase family 2 protein [Thiohalorhabdus sp.]|uniref:glycosyltransferase family 2 protein n=1 Tax=Thiohalorhabdus sp. TaxID=3094134 RepID=UPI00397EC256
MRNATTLPPPALRERQDPFPHSLFSPVPEQKPDTGHGIRSGKGPSEDIGEDWPLVSVIIPAYNAAQYIGAALDSVLAQDYPRKEIIVVDDGSTDDTRAVLEGYAGHIRVLTQANAGAAAARNKGLECARGAYIAFLDADDVWLPGKLSRQVTYMERNPHVLMSYGKWEERWMEDTRDPLEGNSTADEGEGDDLSVVPACSGWLYTQLLHDFAVWTSVVMMKRELFQRIGGFTESLKQGQDFEYWLRASRVTEIHMLSHEMALYRKHPRNTTAGCPARNYAAEIIEEALNRWGVYGPDGNQADRRMVKANLAYLWFLYGWKNKNAQNFQTAFSAFIKSAFYNPRQVKTWPLIVLSGLHHLRSIARHSLESTGDLNLIPGETEEVRDP